MRNKTANKRNLLQNSLFFLGFLLFIILTVSDPQSTFQAALRGLDAWWSIVFPALLPFFVISELAVSLGIVQFFGVLLEPIMRPLFNVPGTGAFVMAVGYTSGAPVSAALTARLRKDKLCSRAEAERLVSFTNNASPLFMLVAIGIGMLDNAILGWIIALSHYLANISIGLILRFYRHNEASSSYLAPSSKKSIFKTAWQAMSDAQQQNDRPLGLVLGDAVRQSVQTLTLIGGFIIFFAVVIHVMTAAGIVQIIAAVISLPLKPLGFDSQVLLGIASGLFEMTLGSKLVSETSSAMFYQVSATTMILGWAGISIHAQAAAMLGNSDISMRPYVLSRLGQGLLGSIYSILIMKFFYPAVLPAFAFTPSVFSKTSVIIYSLSGLLMLVPFSLLSILIYALGKLRLYLIKL